MKKSATAFRTISEVANWLDTPAHVLRFWETKFPEISPVKRAGGRRYYRPEDMRLLGGLKHLLHVDGLSIKAVQTKLVEDGVNAIAAFSPALDIAPTVVARPEGKPDPVTEEVLPDTESPTEPEITAAEQEASAPTVDVSHDPENEESAETSTSTPTDPSEDDGEPQKSGFDIGFFFDDTIELVDDDASGGNDDDARDDEDDSERIAVPPFVPTEPRTPPSGATAGSGSLLNWGQRTAKSTGRPMLVLGHADRVGDLETDADTPVDEPMAPRLREYTSLDFADAASQTMLADFHRRLTTLRQRST